MTLFQDNELFLLENWYATGMKLPSMKIDMELPSMKQFPKKRSSQNRTDKSLGKICVYGMRVPVRFFTFETELEQVLGTG